MEDRIGPLPWGCLVSCMMAKSGEMSSWYFDDMPWEFNVSILNVSFGDRFEMCVRFGRLSLIV